MQNDISLGTTRWGIENSAEEHKSYINVEFKDSYNIEKIKLAKCTLWDTNSTEMYDLSKDITITEVADVEGFNKKIQIPLEHELNIGISYGITIAFYDIDGNMLTKYEPDNIVTNK